MPRTQESESETENGVERGGGGGLLTEQGHKREEEGRGGRQGGREESTPHGITSARYSHLDPFFAVRFTSGFCVYGASESRARLHAAPSADTCLSLSPPISSPHEPFAITTVQVHED